MDSFQTELRRAFLENQKIANSSKVAVDPTRSNPNRYLFHRSSFKTFFRVSVFFLFLANATFLIQSHNTFLHLEDASQKEKAWTENYNIGFLKLENSLNKLFLNQREFLAGEVRRTTDLERTHLETTYKELNSILTGLIQQSKNEYPSLNQNLSKLESDLKNWSEIQNELDTWVKSGDPDTALALFLDKGITQRSEILKPFKLIKEEILSLNENHKASGDLKRNNLKKRSITLGAIGLVLLLIFMTGLMKLETLLTKFSEYLRRWIFASRATDNLDDFHKSLDSLHRNLLTLRSKLWGLKGFERIPQNPHNQNSSDDYRQAG